MNSLDACVTEVTSPPYQRYNKWWVEVTYTCWGSPGITSVMCNSEEEANKVVKGFIIQV